MLNLNTSILSEMPLLLPPLPEQRKIAAILSTWDEAIALTERLIAALQQRKQGLMQRLLTGQVRFPGFEGEWRQVHISSIAKVNPPKPKVLYDDFPVSFIGMADVSEDARITNTETRSYRDVSNGFTGFRDGDVIVAKITPCLENGKGALAAGLKNGVGFGSTEFHILRADLTRVTPSYLFYHTVTHDFRGRAEMNMVGSAGQKRVPADFIRAYQIPLPSLDEQARIVDALHTCDVEIDMFQQRVERIGVQKKGLMQRLLTGQIRVKVD